MIRPYYVFKLRALSGSRRHGGSKGPYGNSDAAMRVIFDERSMEEVVEHAAAYLSGQCIYPVGISFTPPVSVYLPPQGEPLLVIPFTKAEQKKFLSLLAKRREVPEGVRKLLAA